VTGRESEARTEADAPLKQNLAQQVEGIMGFPDFRLGPTEVARTISEIVPDSKQILQAGDVKLLG
jgi:hypothetical protein